THSDSFSAMSRVRSSNATTAPSENVRVAASSRIFVVGVGGWGLGVGAVAILVSYPQPLTPNPQLVPPWVAGPGATVAFDSLVDHRLVDDHVVRQLGLGLDCPELRLLLDGVVDQLLRHAVVDAPHTA